MNAQMQAGTPSKIVDYHLDECFDWIADLECGHQQHVRHNPIGPSFSLNPLAKVRGTSNLAGRDIMALNITNKSINDVIVVHLSGTIFLDDESTSLRVHVKNLLGKSHQVVLDLEKVTRIDSSGLGTLVALYISARRVGGDIKLANLGNHIREALRITRLVTVFDIFARTEDAVASFNKATAAGS